MSWTSPDDVIDAWIGSGAPTDSDQVQIWIDKAERLIRRQVPDIQERIDAEAEAVPPSMDLFEAAVDTVVAAVTRVYRNPDGVRQVNETTGPFTASKTYSGDTPGTLYLTDEELAGLQGVADSAGAFTVDLIPTTSPYYVEPS